MLQGVLELQNRRLTRMGRLRPHRQRHFPPAADQPQVRSNLHKLERRIALQAFAHRPNHLLMSRAIDLDTWPHESEAHHHWMIEKKGMLAHICSFLSRYPTLLAFTVGDYRRVSFLVFVPLFLLLSIDSDAIMS